MIKVLFVCHGNICRSPMAELILKDLAEQRKEERLFIASAATSTEELGNLIYPPAREILLRHGLSDDRKRARQIRKEDYENYDFLIGMDERNIGNMLRFFGGDPQKKIRKLLSYAGENRDVRDPWYTGEFEETWDDIVKGCEALLDEIQKSLK